MFWKICVLFCLSLTIFVSSEIEDDDKNFELDDRANNFNWSLGIYPGTKWCGKGNIAENDDDLGTEAETDKCCRTHDHCDDIIEAFQKKHGLRNFLFYTRLNCRCDEEFRKCLKNSNTKTSKEIGTIYFTVLGTPCFKNDYPIEKCEERSLLPRPKCIKYKLNEKGAKKYQWFDVANF